MVSDRGKEQARPKVRARVKVRLRDRAMVKLIVRLGLGLKRHYWPIWNPGKVSE